MLLREQREVNTDTALRLGCAFDSTPEFWINLQLAYDLRTPDTEARDIAREVQACHLSAPPGDGGRDGSSKRTSEKGRRASRANRPQSLHCSLERDKGFEPSTSTLAICRALARSKLNSAIPDHLTRTDAHAGSRVGGPWRSLSKRVVYCPGRETERDGAPHRLRCWALFERRRADVDRRRDRCQAVASGGAARTRDHRASVGR